MSKVPIAMFNEQHYYKNSEGEGGGGGGGALAPPGSVPDNSGSRILP